MRTHAVDDSHVFLEVGCTRQRMLPKQLQIIIRYFMYSYHAVKESIFLSIKLQVIVGNVDDVMAGSKWQLQ
jgi:hypothetical protein